MYRGKLDQKYPLFVLYNKSNVPKRLADKKSYKKVLKSLLDGCLFLQKNKCKITQKKTAPIDRKLEY